MSILNILQYIVNLVHFSGFHTKTFQHLYFRHSESSWQTFCDARENQDEEEEVNCSPGSSRLSFVFFWFFLFVVRGSETIPHHQT